MGNWNLHLACAQAFLPWFFAYDRLHFARYGSVYCCDMLRYVSIYCCDMLRLIQTHPEAYAAFNKGDFVAQHTWDSKFAQVAADQTIEQIVNKNTKTPGGIIGSIV